MAINRFTTGLTELDRVTGPLGAGRLMTVSGISQSGMTTTLLTIARHAAVDQGVSTLFVDLETNAGSIATRLLAAEAGVDHYRGDLEGSDAVATARALLTASQIQILGPGPRNLDEVRSAVTETGTRPRLIVIDGARFLTSLHADPAEEMDRLAVALKVFAGRMGAAVVVTHPLLHTPESERCPSLDHAEYGMVCHSDHFVILHRPDMAGCRSRLGEVELRVMKNRHGRCGSVVVGAQWKFSRLVSLGPTDSVAA